jgi:hypothetical protein
VKTPSAVIVTEGPLKADVAAQRLGLHVIAVPGFALWRRAIPLLGALSPLRCAVAFDQDAEPVTAMLVGSVVREFADTLSEMGVQAFSAHWHAGKGIDDALAHGERIEFTAL